MRGKKWSFIFIVSYILLAYAFIDFAAQIIYQFPYIYELEGAEFWGLRKIWLFNQ